MKISLKIIILLLFNLITAQEVSYEELEQLIENNKVAEFKTAILKNNIDVNNETNIELTLLYTACRNGNTDIVKFLLEQGANPNAISVYGMPANWAAEKGNLAAINLLLDYGFDPKKETLTYWMNEYKNGKALLPLLEEVVKRVEENNLPTKDLPYTAYIDPADPLILSAAIYYDSIGDFTLAKRLIAAETNVNLSDKVGKTALHDAIGALNAKGVKFLIENGADVNKPIKSELASKIFRRKEFDDNMTPLHSVLYVISGKSTAYNTHKKEVYKIVKLLIKAGADPNIKTYSDGKSVIDKAKDFGDAKLLRIIS